MTLQTADLELIGNTIEKYYNLAKQQYATLEKWKKPVFSLSGKGTTAGRAYLLLNKIDIQPVLFIQNREDMVSNTIPHEVAHLVAFMVYGDRGHGSGWKSVMRRFGLEPSRCHNYDVTSVKRTVTLTRFVYSCNCAGRMHNVTCQMHNKIKEKRMGAICRICNCPINFTGNTATIRK